MTTTAGRLLTAALLITTGLLITAGLLITSAAAVASPEVAAASAPTPRLAVAASTRAAHRPSKVRVPAKYVYAPKRGSLHDYCTMAPDEFPAPHARNADFRGPCARHDLCYAGSDPRKSCDKALQSNMFRNCEHYYGRYNPLRTACKAVAVTYWAAVTIA